MSIRHGQRGREIFGHKRTRIIPHAPLADHRSSVAPNSTLGTSPLIDRFVFPTQEWANDLILQQEVRVARLDISHDALDTLFNSALLVERSANRTKGLPPCIADVHWHLPKEALQIQSYFREFKHCSFNNWNSCKLSATTMLVAMAAKQRMTKCHVYKHDGL